MKEYLIIWKIDVDDANNPIEAAQKAWKLRNDKGSIANVFTVREKLPSGKLGKKITVDLLEHKK